VSKTIQFLLAENTFEHVLFATALFSLTLSVLLYARRWIIDTWRTSSSDVCVWQHVVLDGLAATNRTFILALALLAGLTEIQLPARLESIPCRGMLVLLVVQAGIWCTRALQSWAERKHRVSTQNGDSAAITSLGVLSRIVQFVIWVTFVLLGLDNVGINITALVTSLGIGGVAVALALQTILGDMFASLSIALDRPFAVGDFIVVDDHMGNVKHVGIKTTRVQSLSGEELVFSNNDLLKSRIRNFKRMEERRVVFTFGVSYDNRPEALDSLCEHMHRLIEAEPETRFDRAHIKGFQESSLAVEVVYYVLTPDFNLHMAIQHRLNLAILKHCAASGIKFGYPVRRHEMPPEMLGFSKSPLLEAVSGARADSL
jgi:small-conductance mechanosensitive channel